MSKAYSGVVSLEETEGITTVQAAAMLLHQAAYHNNKEVADFADCIVEGKFLTKWKTKLPVESASLLMSTLQIGKDLYTKMRSIFKADLGNSVVPRYELVAQFNTAITPTSMPLG